MSILQADKYICWDPPNFQLDVLYTNALEEQLAKCSKGALKKPKITECTIDAPVATLHCSDGSVSSDVTFSEANNWICRSNTDVNLLRIYRNDLLKAIAQCTSSGS